MPSFDDIDDKKLKKLKKHGYEFVKTKTEYELSRLSGLNTIVHYKTGKLLVQGSKDKIEETVKLLKFLGIVKEQKGYSGCAIGSDETLKGDTFGGIVVAGFKADDKIRVKLKELGVKDSKRLLKPDVVELAKKIMKLYPKNYHIENIYPAEYNKMNVKMNVTEILDKLHERCYKKLKCKKTLIHIVDLYPGCKVGNIKEKRAESKYLEVAAASIIARYGALEQVRDLEMKAGFFIPLGSTEVEPGMLEIKKKSLNPKDFVKLKFRNVLAFF